MTEASISFFEPLSKKSAAKTKEKNKKVKLNQNMQRALTSGCHEDDLPPPHDPNHLAPPNISWLSRLSSGHRRGSMGFSEIGGTSMIDDENSNSFQGKSNLKLYV